MPRRQQRTSAQRRNFPANQPRIPACFDWVIDHIDGNDVYVAPCLQDSLVPDTAGVYVVNGTPAFLKNTELAQAAVMVGQLLKVTFVSPGGVAGDLTLRNGTMNWQGPLGSFASPKTLTSYAKVATGVDALVVTGIALVMTVDAAGGVLFMNGTAGWEIVETGATPTTWDLNGTTLTTTWTVLPLVGETLRMTANAGFFLNEAGGSLITGDFIVA